MSRAGNKYGKMLATAVAALVVGGAAPAWADTIHLTNGNFNLLMFDGASFSMLATNGDSVSGEIGSAGFAYVPPYACFSSTGACAGQKANLSLSDSLTSNPGGSLSVNVIEGGMFLGGVRYIMSDFSYRFTAGDIVTPLNGSASTRFTFTATGTGTSLAGQTTTVDWTGAGTATAMYGSTNGWGESDYTFSAQASPTPEPASVTLLGPGVAGLFFLGRRRHSSRAV